MLNIGYRDVLTEHFDNIMKQAEAISKKYINDA